MHPHTHTPITLNHCHQKSQLSVSYTALNPPHTRQPNNIKWTRAQQKMMCIIIIIGKCCKWKKEQNCQEWNFSWILTIWNVLEALAHLPIYRSCDCLSPFHFYPFHPAQSRPSPSAPFAHSKLFLLHVVCTGSFHSVDFQWIFMCSKHLNFTKILPATSAQQKHNENYQLTV